MLDPMPRKDLKVPQMVDDEHLWRFWNDKALELSRENVRLRKMLVDHNICPDAEYIGPGGLRVDPPASREEPTF